MTKIAVHIWPVVRLSFVIALVACATTAATPKMITDTKQLVGSWNGSVGCRGCAGSFHTTLLIREDATWVASVSRGMTYQGVLGIEGGVLRWGPGGGRWYGIVSVVEQGGREYVSLVKADGSVWAEFQRN